MSKDKTNLNQGTQTTVVLTDEIIEIQKEITDILANPDNVNSQKLDELNIKLNELLNSALNPKNLPAKTVTGVLATSDNINSDPQSKVIVNVVNPNKLQEADRERAKTEGIRILNGWNTFAKVAMYSFLAAGPICIITGKVLNDDELKYIGFFTLILTATFVFLLLGASIRMKIKEFMLEIKNNSKRDNEEK